MKCSRSFVECFFFDEGVYGQSVKEENVQVGLNYIQKVNSTIFSCVQKSNLQKCFDIKR